MLLTLKCLMWTGVTLTRNETVDTSPAGRTFALAIVRVAGSKLAAVEGGEHAVETWRTVLRSVVVCDINQSTSI